MEQSKLPYSHQGFAIGAALFVWIIKLSFLLTHHIQEDAFITWRVAQNLLDYGVIGFNGPEKISASTTHLYVFLSYFFNLILGKENFIYPLLTFNSFLFTIGTFWLSKLLFKNGYQQGIFIIIFALLPPSIKISILGMEYGLLFFLYMALLQFGFNDRKKWALYVLPIFIIFTRVDTLIFLGILFIVDLFWNKKWNWPLALGSLLGIGVLLAFNWFYFGEIVNNTIVAKKLAYDQNYTAAQNWEYLKQNIGNFWGMVKLPTTFNPITLVIILFEIIAFIVLINQKNKRNFFLWFLFLFAWSKQIIFISQRSLFDWYYWVPQILLFVPILVLILDQKKNKGIWLSFLVVFYILPMILFQTVHSIASGNGEWNYRREIGLFLNNYEKDKNQWIFLEPAGYVPYYSGLKTIDEVGLVDKGVQEEIKKDKKNFKINTVKDRKPKYILSYTALENSKNRNYYMEHYRLIKKFRIKDHLDNNEPILNAIHHLKPSGTDYNLYEKIK